jgi:putative membrane protein
MVQLANIFVAIVAGVHFLVMAIEMFAWRRPAVHGRLGFDQDEANKAAPIVANAGLYNGFIAAGLVWGLFGAEDLYALKVFFLLCVIIAGVFGAVTLKWTTLLLQSVPAGVALVLTWLTNAT